ncbi:Multidrug resistance efflux pump [Pseudomonas frederiksbergensis]|jgi:Multidrug resistance efflux pump|uniref:Multidrug resistance efflux pump n=1 Tax=Pseudomonas frederiksbergensis TaxID=104087 RepID=A0A1H5CNH8_9PSED|nr:MULTISPECIES: HlyD family secretion protein [Pseudomonas]PMU07777.1 HlyD family secretion protein [Pseudomonas sp. FW305-20]PMU18321.1 HlyD family secretion protein [Pseudomonas sp. FW305-122]PMU39628.1 HlyD family secretion protein [Pseudomonas sp. FW305-47B]PMX57168.1 HlyD family secretion protein [Pseudomonas sp. FW305-33]PMX62657.1 HlyD family secretion protein [Pseudomonas sp. FW305-60]
MSEAAKPTPETPVTQAPAPAADPAKKGIKWVLLLILLSLTWYLLADRFTPYTQQARVGAFVIPVASEVAGRVIRVNVRNNQDVKAGEVLFEVDPQPYQIAVDRARADLESTRRQIGASTAGIASAQANLRAAQANELKARQDNQRLEGLYREDPGTISVRLLEVSRANREQAVSQVAAARAEVQRAREQEGGSEEDNALLRSAATALSKAELDLSNTQIRARSAGLITDLRTDAGQFAAAGSPVMTLIALHDVWVSADMTENNLGLVKLDTPVSIVLDALPGEIFKGRVRSVGYGVSVGQTPAPGTLPSVQNSRDWLRPAQRFPVIIEFSPDSLNTLRDSRGIRAGGQAEVMAFPTEGNPLNPLGHVFVGFMSWLSYAY